MFLIPPVTVLWPSQSISTWPEQKNPLLKCENPHSKILFTCKVMLKMMARKGTNSLTLTPSHITDPISHTFTFLTSSEMKNKDGMRKNLQWSCQSWPPDLWHGNPVIYKGWGRDAEKTVLGMFSLKSDLTHCFISKNMFSSTFMLGCILKVETYNTIADVWFLTRI
jgi:hypothetical protein